MLVQLLYLLIGFIIATIYQLAVFFGDTEADTEAYLRWQTLRSDFVIYGKDVAAWFKAIFVFQNH